MANLKSNIVRFGYKRLLKPYLFCFDPEDVHDRMLAFGRYLGRYSLTKKMAAKMFVYSNPMLEQKLLGINFPNPIGLSAGFDKDAELLNILPEVGFGFIEVGSITGEKCLGNPRPRLWRLKKSQALLVNYGLKSAGVDFISRRLQSMRVSIPVGTNIAKTNNEQCAIKENGIADYVKSFQLLSDVGDYFTVNISCPNAFGGQPFNDAKSFGELMTEIDKIPTSKPIFVKFSPDMDHAQFDALLAEAKYHRIHGFIISNLTKNRSNVLIKEQNIPEVGGISGKVLEDLANDRIAYVYKKTLGKYLIIGVGGIFSAADAYKKIRSGASLVGLITGMIYEGPQLIGEINRGLVELIKRDGFNNISQAIGADFK